MPIMNLPKLPAGLNSVDECVKTYLGRLPAGDPPWPHVSTLLTAYMSWPNDQQRGNSFIATCLTRLGMSSEESAKDLLLDSRVNAALEMFGGMNALANVAFDQLSGEIGQVQRWWFWVADIFQLIVDMDHDERAVLRGGSSISKAIDLCECEPNLPGHSQLRGAWSELRDVAHLLAASAHLAHEGLVRADTHDASILKAIWIAPDAVLALAYGMQEFGLHPKPIAKEPSILRPDKLWRIPENQAPAKPFIAFRRLTEAQRDFLNSRRVFNREIRECRSIQDFDALRDDLDLLRKDLDIDVAQLFDRVREQAGRDASPTVAIIDSQTAKGAQKGGLGSILRATTRARRSRVASGTSWSTRWASC